MADLRVTVTISNRTNLPEDAFVNTFYFRSNMGTNDGAIVTDLVSFYNDVHAPGTQSLGTFLSNAASRQVNSMAIRQYNLADAKPREPSVAHYALDDPPPAQGFPAEVALCLSYYADRNVPRRRGRIYLGPLGTNGGDLNLTEGDCRPTLELKNALLGAAKYLRDAVDVDWCTRSTVDGSLHSVTAGWVDNAFDTQRRRGVKAVSRLTF